MDPIFWYGTALLGATLYGSSGVNDPSQKQNLQIHAMRAKFLMTIFSPLSSSSGFLVLYAFSGSEVFDWHQILSVGIF